ncbi:Coenzyme F420 hydrogenase/dehydrogenase, beta subunit C-terminal domain [Clostridium sp. C8]|uniref:Coenzyme F420 hydrogenase/dehydrogenase, beta subunit C-terminal domain n=1 Tax=Clostridium sp. C8 TaxID=1667357 RepID=UPI0006589C09|nr:Coenzyme F420 hydrogenase/dehydrogenase, beta subunit C-terminal domain [Clostridium sp. C8]KLE14593.1 hypothetical protein AAT22_15795 [Clostridium sp. C8]
MSNKSIKKLVVKDLCYQCGTCKSICPTKAIEMINLEKRGLIYPSVNEQKCINCTKCLQVCPINNIDANENHLPNTNDFIGIYNSTDKERFDYTASGGIVTEIIKYLFETNQINKAVVTGMDKEKADNSKVYIIDDICNLKEISGSVYQPVAVNSILDRIEKEDRVAFVGLPCHIRGLDLFLNKNKSLKESIFIKIGIICSIGRGKHGTNLTLKKSLGIKNKEEIEKIIYRYGMPPGTFKVKLKNSEEKNVDMQKFNDNTDYIFIPKGCLFCNDIFNDKADITVGDPWGMKKGKKAMAIIRNERTKDILNKMVNCRFLDFEQEITPEECIRTQNHAVNYKIYNYESRISTYKKLGIEIPKINDIKLKNNSIKENLGYSLLMLNSLYFNSSIGFKSTEIINSKILYKYRNKVLSINTKKSE